MPRYILSAPSKVAVSGAFELNLGQHAYQVTAYCVWLLDKISEYVDYTLYADKNVLSMKVWA